MQRTMRGFTLVELMVALALGLLVVSAVVAFVVALVRANGEIVSSARLDQELRATMALIAADLRRARGVDDPIAALAPAGIDLSTRGCVRYAHGEEVRALRVESGRVLLARAADAVHCDGAGAPITSDRVEITALVFERPGDNMRRVDVVLTGRLRHSPVSLVRTLRQSVAIGSNGI